MKYINWATPQEAERLTTMAKQDKANQIERRRIWDRCRQRALKDAALPTNALEVRHG